MRLQRWMLRWMRFWTLCHAHNTKIWLYIELVVTMDTHHICINMVHVRGLSFKHAVTSALIYSSFASSPVAMRGTLTKSPSRAGACASSPWEPS